MPNLQGGKKYKSSKHSQETTALMHEIAEDQQVGRIMKVLGNRRMLVYCNDNMQRICKIRGALGKKSWINVGDVVLISVREELAAGSTGSLALSKVDINGERGDILAKYDSKVISQLKKTEGINLRLFLNIESVDSTKALDNLNENGEEDFFSDNEEDEDEKFETKPKSKEHRTNKAEEDDLDIDAI